jgi:hypothetical protein
MTAAKIIWNIERKENKMKIGKFALSIVLGLFLFCIEINAQISTREIPIGIEKDFGKGKVPVIVMTDIDLVKLQAEDEMEKEMGLPPRFGFLHSVDLNLLDEGSWQTLENGDKICQLTIVCPNALSVNLLYDKFWLPKGAKYFIYSQDKKYHIGAFTELNNKGSKDAVEGFATGLVPGDAIILEYYSPKNCTESAVISLSGVVHGYRSVLGGYGPVPGNNFGIGFGQSGDCQVNINCPEGNNWQKEKHAVALIIIGGTRHGTGSLINNTNNDYVPYFLTADHNLGGYSANGNSNLSHWTFYWNYELPSNNNNCK